ncbi:MAG: hypothetical protein HYY16_09345 [Planctomycetes bacterium]|nr:hypothetical protein [Planctomycetota bacterium]
MRIIFVLAFICTAGSAWAQDRWVRMTNGDWDRIEKDIDTVKPGDDVAAIKDSIARTWKKFDKVGDKNSAEAKACHQRGKDLEKKLEDKVSGGNKAVEEMGDVEGQLKLLQEHFPEGRIEPPVLKEPFTTDRVQEWVARIKELGEVRKQGVDYLRRVDQKVKMGRDEKFQYFLRQFERYIPENLQKGVDETFQSFDNIIRMYVSINVTDGNAKEEKAVLQMTESLTRGIVTAEARSYCEEQLKGKKDETHEKELEKFRSELKKLEGAADAALKNARLPAGIDRPELAKIAEESLKAAKVEFVKLRVREDKKEHSKVAWDSGAFHLVEWETFHVAVAQKHGGSFVRMACHP